jgi:hypothetical protein
MNNACNWLGLLLKQMYVLPFINFACQNVVTHKKEEKLNGSHLDSEYVLRVADVAGSKTRIVGQAASIGETVATPTSSLSS